MQLRRSSIGTNTGRVADVEDEAEEQEHGVDQQQELQLRGP